MSARTPSTAQRTEPTAAAVLVLDVASLRFSRAEGTVTVLSAPGEQLAVLDDAPGDDRQAAAAVLESALATARVFRLGVPHRVALYNPHTAQVALGAFPAGTVLGTGAALAVPAEGSAGTWDGERLALADGTELVTVEAAPLVGLR